MTASISPVVHTTITDIEDELVRETVEEAISLSRQLLVARKRESEAAEQKADVWSQLQQRMSELPGDLVFQIDGVGLSYRPGGHVETKVPDEAKVAEVAGELLAREEALRAELAKIEYELEQFRKAHTRVVKEYKKPSLTVRALKR